MLASKIITPALVLLQDIDGTRWPAEEMLGWLNAGVREIAVMRPDVMSRTVRHALIEGTRQTIPANAVKLIEVIRNASGRPVSLIKDRRLLDVSAPNWHRMPAAAEIRQFLFDLRDSDVFYVYPPARAGAEVDMVVAQLPPPVTATNSEVGVPDIYESALLDYVMYRALTKDSEYAANAALAAAHYQAFAVALAGDLQASIAARPRTTGTTQPPTT